MVDCLNLIYSLDYNQSNLVGKQTQIHRNVMVWTVGGEKNARGSIVVELGTGKKCEVE